MVPLFSRRCFSAAAGNLQLLCAEWGRTDSDARLDRVPRRTHDASELRYGIRQLLNIVNTTFVKCTHSVCCTRCFNYIPFPHTPGKTRAGQCVQLTTRVTVALSSALTCISTVCSSILIKPCTIRLRRKLVLSAPLQCAPRLTRTVAFKSCIDGTVELSNLTT